MGYDYMELSASPTDDCAQSGREGYYELVHMECKAYIAQLHRQFGDELPGSAEFVKKSNPYDGDPYYEVAVRFDEHDEVARSFAYDVEDNMPTDWDDQAHAELAAMGYWNKLALHRKAGRG